MKRIRLYLIFIPAVLAVAGAGFAEVPRLVNYQGTVTGGTGPLNGSHAVAFAIYADSLGGAALWSETHPGVTFTQGLFNVILGRFTAIPDDLFSSGERWLGVKIGEDVEMAPRMRLTAVPWAMRAALAESCLVAAPDGDWTISGANVYRLSGNVGIGTSTPSNLLDARSAVADAYINVSGRDDGISGLLFARGAAYLRYDEAAPEVRLWNAVTGGNAGDIAFGTSNLERLRIKVSGQVGIGVSAPTDLLEVAGTVRMNGFRMPTDAASGYVLTCDGTGAGTWQAPTGGASDGDWTISGDNQYSAVSGNVGIGTTSPGSKLAVHSSGQYGIYGNVTGPSSVSIYGEHSNGNVGYLGGAIAGAFGIHESGENYGTLGTASYGVYGYGVNGNEGYLGGADMGAYGKDAGSQNWGYLGSSSFGALGTHNLSGKTGILGSSLYGACGYNPDTTWGYLGWDSLGVYGYTETVGCAGVKGSYGIEHYGSLGVPISGGLIDGAGVYGYSYDGYGIWARASTGTAGYFSGGSWAARFNGDVHIYGTLSKAHGSFVIDHPLDPENKILRHMFVESPENLCLYRGKVTLDASGEAVVTLPSYFAALTKEEEATVSLTSIGRPFLAGYEWQSDYTAFTVYGEPGREVSWVTYADRDDPAARKLTRPVEEEKGPDNKLCDRGRLLNP